MDILFIENAFHSSSRMILETELGPVEVRVMDMDRSTGFAGMIFTKVTFMDIHTGVVYRRLFTEQLKPNYKAIKEPSFFD